MKKINDISNLSTLITYHRYMFSKDQAEILFKNIAIPEYIALEEIKDSLENGKVYLKVISDNMKRIGIVTYHKAWNNGAFLQAYALQSYLEGNGFYVNVVDNDINFKSLKSDNPLANKWWRAYEKRILECQQLLHIASDKEYDTVVYGSDEICWL